MLTVQVLFHAEICEKLVGEWKGGVEHERGVELPPRILHLHSQQGGLRIHYRAQK